MAGERKARSSERDRPAAEVGLNEAAFSPSYIYDLCHWASDAGQLQADGLTANGLSHGFDARRGPCFGTGCVSDDKCPAKQRGPGNSGVE